MGLKEDQERLTNNLAGWMDGRLKAFKEEIVEEFNKARAMPDRFTDRVLVWVTKRQNSWAWVLGFAFLFTVVGSVITIKWMC